jgi:hypothetical protein
MLLLVGAHVCDEFGGPDDHTQVIPLSDSIHNLGK